MTTAERVLRNPQSRIWLTLLLLGLELLHLAWEHAQGGVLSHNILNRSDLPAISNLWGVLVIPALAWFAIGQAQRRMVTATERGSSSRAAAREAAFGFFGALLYGALLAASFRLGFEQATSYIFLGAFVIGILLPVYRGVCLLGFVVGMAFVFGAVLPTVVGSIIAVFSALIHLLIRSMLRLYRGRGNR